MSIINTIQEKVFSLWSDPDTTGQKVARGGTIASLETIIKKGIQIARSIIVARILFPDDFGLLGLAVLATSIVDMSTQTGFESSIVQKKNLTDQELNSQWSLNVIRGFVIGAVTFFIAAPIAADFFSNPAVANIVRALAVIMVIDGFQNMGAFLFERHLQLNKRFYYALTGVITGAVVTIGAALVLRNVWALVLGKIAGVAAYLVASYVLHPYRPRFTLNFSGAKRLFRFGKWITISSVLTFLVTRGDYVVIGRLLDAEQLGFYQYAFTLGLLPTVEIAKTLSSVLFPLYSRLQDNVERMRRAFVRVLRVVVALMLPAAVGFLVLADPIVLRVLGEKWLPIVPILSVTVFIGFFQTFETLVMPLFMGTGKPHFNVYVMLLRVGAMFALIIPLTERFGTVGTALAFLIGVTAAVLWLFIRVRRELTVGLRTLLRVAALPLVATIVMGGVLYVAVGGVFLSRVMIIVWVLAGATLYGGVLFGLDQLLGRKYWGSLQWIKRNL